MRGTGSNTVSFGQVFVPEEAIALRRPMGEYHPAWNVVLTVAMPLIVSAYVGVAEAAAEKAIRLAGKKRDDHVTQFLVGELRNELTAAQIAQRDMVSLADDLRFTATTELADEILVRKTLAAKAVRRTADKALEVAGGFGFHRASGIERLVRDSHGALFHPLTEKRLVSFSGRLALDLEPIEFTPARAPEQIEVDAA